MICALHESILLQHDSQLRFLRWQWHGPLSLLHFQVAFERLLLFSRQNKVQQWLGDVARMPQLGIDEQTWMTERWVDQFARSGVQNLALMLPKDQHNQLAMEHILESSRHCNRINIQFFSDYPSALDWLSGSSESVHSLENEWNAAVSTQ